MTEEPGTIIYSKSPNVQVADDQGNLHRAQLVAVAPGEIVFNTPDNSPNVQVADDQGNLHRAQLVAMIGGGGGGGAVSSVNGKTGAVVLEAEDVSATPQYSIMPIASSELLGQVIQYVGENTGDYKTGEFFKCTDTIFNEVHPAVVVIPNTSGLTVSVDRDTFFAYFGYAYDALDILVWVTDHWEFENDPDIPVDLQELGITCIGTPEAGDIMYVISTSDGFTYSADIMQTYKATGAIIDQDQFNNLMTFACGEAANHYPEDIDILENIRWNREAGVYGVFKYLNTQEYGDCWCFVGSYSDADGETLFPSSEYGYICAPSMFPDMITSQDPSDWAVGESYIYVAVTSTQAEPIIVYDYGWEKLKVSPTDGLVKQIFGFPSEEITPYQRTVFQYAGRNPVTYDGVTFEPNYFYEYTQTGSGGITPTSYTIDNIAAVGLSSDDISVDLDTLYAGLVNLYNNGGLDALKKQIIEYIVNGSYPLYLEWEEGYNFWLATLVNGAPSYVAEIATTNADLAANYGISFPEGDYGSPYSITFTLYGGSISGNRWGYQQVNVQPSGGTGNVVSVNGKTGVVVLDANDVSATPQYSEMPTATADTLNKIVQYVGETNLNYTNGYFYKGVSEEGPITYPMPCYVSKGHSADLGDVSYDNELLTLIIEDIIPEVLDDIYTYKLLFEDDGSGNTLCNLYQVVDPSDPTQDVLLTTSYSPEDLGIFVDSYDIGDYLEFYSIGKNYRGMDINQGDTLIFGVDLDALETAFTTYIGFDILNSQVEDGIAFSFTHLENGYGDDPNLPWMYSWENPDYGYLEGGLTSAEFASFGITFETTPSQNEYFEIVSWPFAPIPGPETYYWQQVEVQTSPDPLPDQTGNSGKFLTTDGTHTSWRTLSLTETITIPANGWSNNTQSVTVGIVTATNTVWVSPTPLCSEDYATAGVMCTAQGNNELVFTCTTTPVNDLTVSVVCL